MASFHQSFQVIKRSVGRSAVAAAAYRSGSRLEDERSGRISDYSRRAGVVHTEIMAPEEAPDWARDRGQLWNRIEAVERRKDAQLAREVNMALPHELTPEARLELVRDYIRVEFVARGMVADFAIHEPVPEKGDSRNVHVHVMLTMRQIGRNGFFRTKTREWNTDDQLVAWRSAWAEAQNRALTRANVRARVDHRSLAAQRTDARARGDQGLAAQLDRVPEIHIGPQSHAAVQRGHTLESRERERGLRKQPRRKGWTETVEGNTRAMPTRPARGPLARRQIRYPQIDRGTRAVWNAVLVERNQGRAFKRAEHRERQAARLRESERRALRTAREIERQLAAMPKAWPWQSGRNQKALAQRAALETIRRLALKRAQRSRALLGDVELILANLLHVRGLHQERHRALVRSMLPGVERARQQGRGRSADWF
ncbi:MobQ family relaxase [Jiella marina]|uniref:MobQ family relaxase n=1 Tax=Jiella sp. LLJ827 TaxID=2917712 RepID=UPI00350E464A